MALSVDQIRRLNDSSPEPSLQLGTLLNQFASSLGSVSFSVAAEGGDAIVITCQARDISGNDMAVVTPITFYLSDSATGDGITATAPDGDIVIATDGVIISEPVADKEFNCNTEVDGDIAFTIGEAAGGTWYLVARIPGVGISVSGAITFAA